MDVAAQGDVDPHITELPQATELPQITLDPQITDELETLLPQITDEPQATELPQATDAAPVEFKFSFTEFDAES